MGSLACIRLILLASTIGSVSLLTMNSSHLNIIPRLTDDVTLNCFHDAQHSSPIVLDAILRIRLLKLNNTSGNWTALAEMARTYTAAVSIFNHSKSDIHLDGHLGDLFMTFLKVTWPRTTIDTAGSYKCTIDGFRKDNGAISTTESNVVDITSYPVTMDDLLRVIIEMKMKSEEHFNKLKQNIQTSIVDNYFELRYWPSESYGLLAPESGCPDTTSSSLVAGSVTVQTETYKAPNNTFSDPNHLRNTKHSRFGSRNIVKFNVCLSERSEPSLMWPNGSYCIHALGINLCPSGFGYGYVLMYPQTFREIILTIKDARGIMGGGEPGQNSRFYFRYCCRSDGNVDNAIRLPALKPFYLYRYKGKCQKVFNMDVSEEWFQLETDDTKTGEYGNAYRPDGKLNDARLELCYYTKKVIT